jgi:hypothetical protein
VSRTAGQVIVRVVRASPWATPGGVGVLQLLAAPSGEAASAALDACLSNLCGVTTRVGQVALRKFGAIDTGLVARTQGESAVLMPHGGLALLRELEAALATLGVQPLHGQAALASVARELFPESRSDVDARALLALAHAPSPDAADCLLAQHERWSRHAAGPHSGPAMVHERTCALRHLLTPALVVLRGRANIGKSTLLNALASQRVSIVENRAGTTRDHVGAMIDCAGLALAIVDTPGLRDTSDAIEQEALRQAESLAQRADLLLLCRDGEHEVPPLPSGFRGQTLVIALRSDRVARTARSRKESSPSTTDVRVGGLDAPDLSIASREGLTVLTQRMREALLPSDLLRSTRPWRFWDDAASSGS